MPNNIRIMFNHAKYKNVQRFKTVESIKDYQRKEIEKLIKSMDEKPGYYHDLLTNSHVLTKDKLDYLEILKTLPIMNTATHLDGVVSKELDIRTGIILARLLPEMSNQKMAVFLKANKDLHEIVKINKIKIEYFDLYEPLEKIIIELSQLQPDVLIAPPSVLMVLADATYNKRLTLNLTKVISIAEVLEESDRDYFIEQFEVKVIGQLYQAEESFLGYTCQYGTLHMNEDVVFIEEDKIDEHRFNPIITDFTKQWQFIVRHRLKDILVHKKEACACGCKFMALEKIEGTEDDVFIFPGENGSEIRMFPDTIRQCVLNVKGIKNYEVIQISEKVIHVNFEIDRRSLFAIAQRKVLQQQIIDEFNKVTDSFGILQLDIVFDEYVHTITKKMKKVRRENHS